MCPRVSAHPSSLTLLPESESLCSIAQNVIHRTGRNHFIVGINTEVEKAVEIDPEYEPAIYNKVLIESFADDEELKPEKNISINYY